MKYKVLIVEDEPEIVTLIKNRLDEEKYDVSIASDGARALKLINQQEFDLVSLDIMLPNVDGLTLCNAVRKKSKVVLIMIVSALDLEEHKERAYSLGADDYIAKPFSPKLVALKIGSLLKRRFELSNPHIEYQTIIQHDSALKKFYVKNTALILTPSEYIIFETLFNASNRVFSKEELSQILYDNDIGNIDKEGIRTFIYTLRKKISDHTNKEIIKTVRNIGFTLYEN